MPAFTKLKSVDSVQSNVRCGRGISRLIFSAPAAQSERTRVQMQFTSAKTMYTVRNQFMCLNTARLRSAVAPGSNCTCMQHRRQHCCNTSAGRHFAKDYELRATQHSLCCFAILMLQIQGNVPEHLR